MHSSDDEEKRAMSADRRKHFLWALSVHLGHPMVARQFKYDDGYRWALPYAPGLYRRAFARCVGGQP